MICDHELFLSQIIASFWKSKVGYIDKDNFLSQFKDQESDVRQFFLLDNFFSAT